MKLIIDRATWGRGDWEKYETDPVQAQYMSSRLLNSRVNRKCCLGFLGQACGIPDAQMQGETLPRESNTKWPKWLFNPTNPLKSPWYTSIELTAFVDANDATEVSETERERRLTELFAAQGVEVEFIG